MISEYQKKWIQAIVKLHRLTQENQLKWHSEPPYEQLQDIKADGVYVTSYKGMQLRLYEIYYTDELDRAAKRLLSVFERPKPERSTIIVLELINPSDEQIVQKVSRVEGLDDLLKTVKSQIKSDLVDDFLDELLKEEE